MGLKPRFPNLQTTLAALRDRLLKTNDALDLGQDPAHCPPYTLHPRRSPEGKYRRDERIFNQALTAFVLVKLSG